MIRSKLILSFVLGVAMILGLASCSLGKPAPSPAPSDMGDSPPPELSESDSSADGGGFTAEEFCELFEGTWITVDGYITYIGFQTETGEPIFVWGIQDSDVFYGAGAITSIKDLGENEYALTVSFPENTEGGFTFDAFEVDVHVRYGDERTRFLELVFGVEPERRHYFDDGQGIVSFVTADDFWSYLLGRGSGELLIDPDTDNFVCFFDIGGSPRFESGTLGSGDSIVGVIVDMTLLEGTTLEILVIIPDSMGNTDTEEAVSVLYTVNLFGDIGVTMYDSDGNFMGDFYFGVG